MLTGAADLLLSDGERPLSENDSQGISSAEDALNKVMLEDANKRSSQQRFAGSDVLKASSLLKVHPPSLMMRALRSRMTLMSPLSLTKAMRARKPDMVLLH